MKRSFDAKIPVAVDAGECINDDKFTTWLGGDNRDIGKQAGEFLINVSKGQGKIVEVMGKAGATPTNDRHQGFADAIAKSPGLKVVIDSYNLQLPTGSPAQTYMENVLQKHTEFQHYLPCIIAVRWPSAR